MNIKSTVYTSKLVKSTSLLRTVSTFYNNIFHTLILYIDYIDPRLFNKAVDYTTKETVIG